MAKKHTNKSNSSMEKKHTNTSKSSMTKIDTRLNSVIDKHWKLICAIIASSVGALIIYEVLT